MVRIRPEKSLLAMMIMMVVLFLTLTVAGLAAEPWRTALSRQADLPAYKGGSVQVRLDWLERPGDFALTIIYWGQLTQAGPVNLWMNLNGVNREMIALNEMPDRRQRLTIYSSQPTTTDEEGKTRIRPLEAWERVDPDLFRNAAYYPQFGQNRLEFKFFVNGRWDGDPERDNGNYFCTFQPPVL